MEILTKGQKSKQKIIEYTINLFAKFGHDGTSIQQIADSSGIKHSTILYHFKSKEYLIDQVIKHIVKNNYNIVREKINFKDNAHVKLRSHCLGNLIWAINYPHQAQVIILLYYKACNSKIIRPLNDQVKKNGRERIAEYLYAGFRENLFSEDQLEEKAQIIHEFLMGSLINILSENVSKKHLKVFEKKLDLIINSLLLN